MNAVYDAIAYEIEKAPASGEVTAVSDTIRWLRMPLPFALSHINLWLVRDGAGWATVDTGLCAKESAKVWYKTIAEQLDGQPPTRALVTHMHPDHVGMAGWMNEKFGVELWMTHGEYYTCRVLAADTGQPAPATGTEFYRAAGFDDDDIVRYQKMFGLFGRAVSPLPLSYRRLREGDSLTVGEHEYTVLIGSGHSPEHACFYSEALGVVFSGDQILPTISSNVSVWPTEPHANPLRDWLDACRRLRERLPENTLCLPAHGKPFRGVRARLTELIDEHTEALDKLLEICAEPRRALDVFPALFKARVSESNRMMATGEALAHLNYLLAEGALRVEREDGIDWYRRA